MNIFRFSGDLAHLISIFILIHKVHFSKSCSGLSFKSQLLYSIVYITRYLDLFTSYVSLYNSLMKIFFIISSLYIIYQMKVVCKPTRDPSNDTLRIEYLIGASFILALIFNYKFTPSEVLWSFSIWLEAFAILPQLFLLQRTGEAESLTVHYIAALGSYRALYLFNWIYRWFSEGHFEPISVFAGLIQTALYSDFFYIYYTRVLKGKKFELPQ